MNIDFVILRDLVKLFNYFFFDFIYLWEIMLFFIYCGEMDERRGYE